MSENKESKIIESKNPHSIKKDLTDIPVEYNGVKTIYRMKQLTSDDIWSITDQTQTIREGNDGEPQLVVDQSMRNKISLSKSIVDPIMTIESISNLPYPVSNLLLTYFNKLNMPDPELLKKTASQVTL